MGTRQPPWRGRARALSQCALALAMAGCVASEGGEGGEGGAGATVTSAVVASTATNTIATTTNASVSANATTGLACGFEGTACCPGSTCTTQGLVCIEGVCAPLRAFGEDCTNDASCSSNLCLESGHCSKSCTAAGDCPPAPEWSCAALQGYASQMCQCAASGAETCDGQDNDCDGVVDGGATCSEPGFTCQAGTCACAPANLCDGVCKDTASDHENCGACGVACDASATCFEGNCLTTLVSGENIPAGLALAGGSLYWANNPDGTVRKVSVGGGAPITLATGQLHPTHVATDATHVYWTTGGDLQGGPGSVMKIPLAGGTPTMLASSSIAWGISVDATNVYWAGSLDLAVQKVPLAGGASSVLVASNSSPWTTAVDASGVYWTQGDGLMRVDHAGGAVTVLTDVAINQTDAIALDATTIYFTTASSVMKIAKTGGPVTTLATQGFPRGIAVDASHVYWADQDGGFVLKVPIDGGLVETVASGQFAPFDVVVDATNVYWNTFSGNIMKAPK